MFYYTNIVKNNIFSKYTTIIKNVKKKQNIFQLYYKMLKIFRKKKYIFSKLTKILIVNK